MAEAQSIRIQDLVDGRDTSVRSVVTLIGVEIPAGRMPLPYGALGRRPPPSAPGSRRPHVTPCEGTMAWCNNQATNDA